MVELHIICPIPVHTGITDKKVNKKEKIPRNLFKQVTVHVIYMKTLQ